ncbi:polysaccharide deacetylase family protein [Paenibacillus luteus]|uniref:polysaccharide deacetylase family protein n=1 Tax=Paenibacillus luteus TaxID=2545753 RepID=UPI0013764509|nr:polysaccharide deacetylase family protein [Paenibacillus luteus]
MNAVYRAGLVLCLFCLLIVSASSVSATTTSFDYKDRVAVLMYHHVHDKDTSSSTISPMQFRDQLVFLRSRGYQFITLEQLRRFLAGGKVPNNAVLLTFDDGYKSFHTFAYPILKDLEIPAVNFSITDYFKKKSPQIPHLSYQEIKEMMGHSPAIDIQCHTNQLHRKIGEKSAFTYIDKKMGLKKGELTLQSLVYDDTSACLKVLKGAGVAKPDAISYPFGIYSRDSFPVLLKSGVRYGFTTKPALIKKGMNMLELPRINAGSPGITPMQLHAAIKKARHLRIRR